jgi:hypothetical protein
MNAPGIQQAAFLSASAPEFESQIHKNDTDPWLI